MSLYEAINVNWRSAVVSSSSTLKEAMVAIQKSGMTIACIVDEKDKLLAILTDSDIRSSILKGAHVEEPVMRWANKNPTTVLKNITYSELQQLSKETGKFQIPILDEYGRIVDLYVYGLISQEFPEISNPVFILAGGEGKRLRPLISHCPKPLALVGKKPLLETIIMNACQNGFRKFFISVNYLADHIEKHLLEDKYNKIDITIVKESKSLGTAGSIGYIKNQINSPLVVMNADVLTTLPLSRIIRHHEQSGALLTCVVRQHWISVPYGVFEVKNDSIMSIREKPDFCHFVNAGIYVLNPEIYAVVDSNNYLDMPDLVQSCIDKGLHVSAFPLHEYWIDVGTPESFIKANSEFEENFIASVS